MRKDLDRRALLAGAGSALLLGAPGAATGQDGQTFAEFVEDLRPEAEAAGISKETFEAAFRDVRAPDPDVIARTRKQGEFSRPVWDYLVSAVTRARIERGQALAKRLAEPLARMEKTYRVPPQILLGFWGIESDFGASGGGTVPVVKALASLAYAGYRGRTFRDELIAALQILQRGDIPPEQMKGSWAGAMGQVQFLPSVYLKHAVDFDGDGRRDIWGSQTDALASAANYLHGIGWNPAYAWGYEVKLPKDFDLKRYRAALSDFATRGVERTDGKPLPGGGEASLFLPGGRGAPVFLITDNFEVIRQYNTSDSYALAVGHLADRIGGAPPLAAPWPTSAKRLDNAGLRKLQEALAAQGLYAGDFDGRAGPKLREAVRQYQIRANRDPDGYASPELLKHVTGLGP